LAQFYPAWSLDLIFVCLFSVGVATHASGNSFGISPGVYKLAYGDSAVCLSEAVVSDDGNAFPGFSVLLEGTQASWDENTGEVGRHEVSRELRFSKLGNVSGDGWDGQRVEVLEGCALLTQEIESRDPSDYGLVVRNRVCLKSAGAFELEINARVCRFERDL
jgi:hypothetical protein